MLRAALKSWCVKRKMQDVCKQFYSLDSEIPWYLSQVSIVDEARKAAPDSEKDDGLVDGRQVGHHVDEDRGRL